MCPRGQRRSRPLSLTRQARRVVSAPARTQMTGPLGRECETTMRGAACVGIGAERRAQPPPHRATIPRSPSTLGHRSLRRFTIPLHDAFCMPDPVAGRRVPKPIRDRDRVIPGLDHVACPSVNRTTASHRQSFVRRHLTRSWRKRTELSSTTTDRRFMLPSLDGHEIRRSSSDWRESGSS